LSFRVGLLKEANMRNFLEGSLTGLTGFMLNRTPVRWAGEKYVNRFVLPDVIRKMTDKGIHYIPGRRNRELFLKTIAGLTADKANRKLLSGSIYEYMLDPDNRRMAIASKMKSILGPSPTKFVPTYYKPPIITDRFSGYTI